MIVKTQMTGSVATAKDSINVSTGCLIELKIYPNRQNISLATLKQIMDTFRFLCRKVGWSLNIIVYPRLNNKRKK